MFRVFSLLLCQRKNALSFRVIYFRVYGCAAPINSFQNLFYSVPISCALSIFERAVLSAPPHDPSTPHAPQPCTELPLRPRVGVVLPPSGVAATLHDMT